MNNGQKDKLLKAFLKEFEKARLIKRSGKRFELTHDSLATKITEKRNANEIAYIEAVRLLKSKLRLSLKPETKDYFTERQLVFLQPFIEREKIKSEFPENDWTLCKNLINESQQLIKEKKEKEKIRLEKEKKQLLEKQALLEKNRRNQRRFIYFLLGASFTLIGLFTYAFYLQKKLADSRLLETLEAEKLKTQGNYEGALKVLAELDQKYSSATFKEIIKEKKDTFEQVRKWMAMADNFFQKNDYRQSLLYIDSSFQLSPDGFIQKNQESVMQIRDEQVADLAGDINRLIEQSRRSDPAIIDAKNKYCQAKYYNPAFDSLGLKKKKINDILSLKGLENELIADCAN